jgi:excisionase family DNA binding protein
METGQSPREAYLAHLEATRSLLGRVGEAFDRQALGGELPADLDRNWGHVGDVAELERLARAMHDHVFKEGDVGRAAGVLTLTEAAEHLGISPETLRHQIKNGRLKAEKLGSFWVVAEDELERYRSASRGRPGRPRKAPAEG